MSLLSFNESDLLFSGRRCSFSFRCFDWFIALFWPVWWESAAWSQNKVKFIIISDKITCVREAINHTFYRLINHLKCWENTQKVWKYLTSPFGLQTFLCGLVLPTSWKPSDKYPEYLYLYLCHRKDEPSGTLPNYHLNDLVLVLKEECC